MHTLLAAMRRLTIRGRLMGSLVAMLVLTGLVSAAGLWSLREQGRQADAFVTRALAQSHEMLGRAKQETQAARLAQAVHVFRLEAA